MGLFMDFLGILESPEKCNCYQIQSNYYLFNYFDDVLNDIGAILSLDFSKKYMRLQDIKNLENVKNDYFHNNFRKQFMHQN